MTVELDLLPVAGLCDGQVARKTECGRDFIYLPGLRFYANGQEHKMDALLCLNHNNPAYPTKLYFASKVPSSLNWNETPYIFGRQWFSFSWRDVKADRPILEILADHLAPLNQGQTR